MNVTGAGMIIASFFYRGQRIIYRGDLDPSTIKARSEVGQQTIVWGQHVSNGWGEGPEGTNYYLHLWTRWSTLPACLLPSGVLQYVLSAGSSASIE